MHPENREFLLKHLEAVCSDCTPLDPERLSLWRGHIQYWQESEPLRFESGVRQVERCLEPEGNILGLVEQLQGDYSLLQIAWMVAEAARRCL